MTREEALGLESIVRYNLTATKHKEAVDVAFDALREQEKCAKSAHCTNADRIRAMGDEELAEFMEELTYDVMEHNSRYWLEWLQQPWKEDA